MIDNYRVLVKYKVDKVRKVGEAKLHISLKIEQCGKVGKVEWAKMAKLGLLFPQILYLSRRAKLAKLESNFLYLSSRAKLAKLETNSSCI